MCYIFDSIRSFDTKLTVAIDAFIILGIIYATKVILRFTFTIFNGFRCHLWSRLWRIDLKQRYGRWAVITGATDGIGLEYARELAKRGIALILVARSEFKLAQVEAELSCLTRVVTIVADLNSDDIDLYHRVAKEIDGYNRDIGILFNNAGVIFDSPNPFMDQPEHKVMEVVRVNIMSLLMITRAVLPGMMERRKGLIINMGSIAGYRPLALLGVYSASKVFVHWFSETLRYEYKSYNIEVQTLRPSYLVTKLTAFSDLLQKPSLLFPSVGAFARNAVATIGRTRLTTGYWSHGLLVFIYDWFVPDWAYRLISWHLHKHYDSTKKQIF